MKLSDLKPTTLSESINRIFKASDRLAVQTQASIADFTANHTERFTEAGTAGGIIIIASLFAKDAVNTLNITQNLTATESLQIHTAVGSVMGGTPLETAIDGLPTKIQLLVQSFLLAYQVGELDESIHKIPADFEVVINNDNSVTTSDNLVGDTPTIE